jgi:hypothetical protein
MKTLVTPQIESLIFVVRGHKVMIDRDLGMLYKVATKALNQAVRRNPGRFPSDFVFQLTTAEKNELVTNCDRFANLKHSRNPPFAFTQDGVSMLSSVLKSNQAVLVNVQIMRAFGRLRELLSTQKELARKLEELEKKYDVQFKVVFDAIRALMGAPKPTGRMRLPPVPKVRGFIARTRAERR